jgi:hypothetical protein
VPLLTEVVELPDTVFEAPAPAPAPAQATVIDTADMPESGVVTAVGDFGSEGRAGCGVRRGRHGPVHAGC